MWYRLNEKHDPYEYVGTQTDDSVVVGPPGSPGTIIAKLSEIFTIKSPGELTFHIGCDYKAETLSGETRVIINTGKLKHEGDPSDPLCKPEAQEESQCIVVRRKHWFLGMQLKPMTKGQRTIPPVEQIRMQREPILIKTSTHPATYSSHAPLSNREHISNSWA